jgi:hypothetical protein
MKKNLTYGPNNVVIIWAHLVHVAAMCCHGGSHGTCGCGVLRGWWWQRGGGGSVVVKSGGGG